NEALLIQTSFHPTGPKYLTPAEGVATLYSVVAALELQAKAAKLHLKFFEDPLKRPYLPREEFESILRFLEGLLSSLTENTTMKTTPELMDLVSRSINCLQFPELSFNDSLYLELISLLHQLAVEVLRNLSVGQGSFEKIPYLLLRSDETASLLGFLEGLLSSLMENMKPNSTPTQINLVSKIIEALDKIGYLLKPDLTPGELNEVLLLLQQLAKK
ncbi:unnamed protein product, partial [Callosobruchus maculatus]